MEDLKNKVVAITGGATGIGFALGLFHQLSYKKSKHLSFASTVFLHLGGMLFGQTVNHL